MDGKPVNCNNFLRQNDIYKTDLYQELDQNGIFRHILQKKTPDQ